MIKEALAETVLAVCKPQIQPTILQEECAELIKEISKFQRGKGNKEHLIEEMAHVLVSIEVNMKLANITEKDIEEALFRKMQDFCASIDKEAKDSC